MNVRILSIKVCPMSQLKTSSRVYNLIKSAVAGAILPILFIYVMIAKPDYKIMNGLAHIVLPVAHFVGDVITWPIRVVANSIDNVSELSNLRAENEELRVRLDAALATKVQCEIAIKENQKLNRELDIINDQPRTSLIADIIHDNSALGNNTFIINRGNADGIENGMVVTTTDMRMLGIIIDTAPQFARVRALTDSDTNIAVRIVGSEVYGFLRGNGSSTPKMEFFSDPEFQPTQGIRLVSSNISGVLPAGLNIGEMQDDTDVKVAQISEISRVIVLMFDKGNEYR